MSILPQNKSSTFCKKCIFTNCLEVVLDVLEGRGKRLLVNEPWNYKRWKWKRSIRLIMNCATSVQSYHFSDIFLSVLNVWTEWVPMSSLEIQFHCVIKLPVRKFFMMFNLNFSFLNSNTLFHVINSSSARW